MRNIKNRINDRKLNFLSKFLSYHDLRKILHLKREADPSFLYENEELSYYYHSYNNSRVTERCIEIPIINFYLNKFPHNNCLEIGNVSKHYYDLYKDFDSKVTLDKYELAYDVINKDIIDYNPENKFDFIFSISTFEHMDSDAGRNENYIPPSNEKFSSQAMINIDHVVENLMKDNSVLIITVPLNYGNGEIDRSIENNEFDLLNIKRYNFNYMEKISNSDWKQSSFQELDLHSLDKKYLGINHLCIVEIYK